MTDEYAPTTAEVRECATAFDDSRIDGDAFDRWLVAHDAETRRRSLHEAWVAVAQIGYVADADLISFPSGQVTDRKEALRAIHARKGTE